MLDEYLEDILDEKFIMCHRNDNPKPQRNLDSPYYISYLDWPMTTFPYFCVGPSYILSVSTAKRLYKTFVEVFEDQILCIEDVYITGILRDLSGIKIEEDGLEILTHSPDSANFTLAQANELNAEEKLAKWKELFGPIYDS